MPRSISPPHPAYGSLESNDQLPEPDSDASTALLDDTTALDVLSSRFVPAPCLDLIGL